LPAFRAREQASGLNFERRGDIVQKVAVQLDRPHGNEKSRFRLPACGARRECSMHGHRLRAVLAQMQGAQASVRASQGIVWASMRRGGQLDVLRIPADNGIEQAHCALVGDERGDRLKRLHGGG
jgi:hypothetical protein